MKMKKLVFIIVVLLCCSCQKTSNNQISKIINEWSNKEIIFPKKSIFLSVTDTIACDPLKQCLKILTYTNPDGCIGCRMKLEQWLTFNKKLMSIDSNLLILKYICPEIKAEALHELKHTGYYFPVCVDMENEIDKLNHFPENEKYHCFLLDENNHVILIGNPIDNTKIRDLYIKTICERKGIDPPKTDVEQEIPSQNLGSFNWKSEQNTTFVIHNTSDKVMLIDTLYSSCECTTAETDKFKIEPADSAIISIRFKADKPEQFFREVYVGVQGRDPIVLSIEGDAVE